MILDGGLSNALRAHGRDLMDQASVGGIAREVTGKPGLAYPNSGQGWESRTHTWSGETSYDVTLAPGWVAAGAA